MQTWNTAALDVQPQQPQVLTSDDEGRVIALHLLAGERLPEHQVHERAWLVVVAGKVKISEPGGESTTGEVGFLAAFDPNERHEVAAIEDSRMLLLLSPWPGESHPSQERGER